MPTVGTLEHPEVSLQSESNGWDLRSDELLITRARIEELRRQEQPADSREAHRQGLPRDTQMETVHTRKVLWFPSLDLLLLEHTDY